MKIFAYLLCLFNLSLIGCSKAAPLIGLPQKPKLTKEGRSLVYNFEVGGGESYYNKKLAYVTWPGFASGCTIGLGYDLGYFSKDVILFDWKKHPNKERLSSASGHKGQSGKIKTQELRDIFTKWSLAEEVFNAVTITKFWQLSSRTFPGFDDLHPNCQAAIISLIFNRGNSLAGPKRVEMRKIKELVPKKDYQGIADQIRKMKKIWQGTDIQKGMERRREAEAKLVESCLK